MPQRGDVSPLSERFRVLVRSIGINVSELSPEMAMVTCETIEDLQRARDRIGAALKVLDVSANISVEDLYITVEMGDPT